MTVRLRFILIILPVLLLVSCSFYGRQRGPSDWHTIRKPTYTIPPYAKWLEGMTFCLDPGHGGQAHLSGYKRGPTGVREAEMNLRLANYLRGFLEEAGARVILTRESDLFVSLEERAEIANRHQVDLFISIHHNAHSNPETNYSSIWYHGDADYKPVNLDVARYLQQALTEYARLPQVATSPLISDLNMYPAGFGVLRRLEVPGVLTEGSFFSNPVEEKLLDRPEYNKLFAWAYFTGLAQWAHAGFPRSELVTPGPGSRITETTPLIQLQLHDGIHERGAWILDRQQILTESVNFYLNDSLHQREYDRERAIVTYQPREPLRNGLHKVDVNMVNMYGNHNLPGSKYFTVAPPAETLGVRIWADAFPPDSRAYTLIEVNALDGLGRPVADGDTITARTGYGVTERSLLPATDGIARFYLHAGAEPGTARVEIASGNASTKLEANFNDSSATAFLGRVSDMNGKALAGVTVCVDSLTESTNRDGHYYHSSLTDTLAKVSFQKPGYYRMTDSIHIRCGNTTVVNPQLDPVAGGSLHEKLIVLDPRFGGSETGPTVNPEMTGSELNLSVAKYLRELLSAAGAEVHLLRTREVFMPVEDRIDSVNALSGDGTYFRLNIAEWNPAGRLLAGSHYPGNRESEEIATGMITELAEMLEDTVTHVYPSGDPEIRQTKFPALGLEMYLANHPVYGARLSDTRFQWQIAYELYQAYVNQYLAPDRQLESALVTVKDKESGQPLAGRSLRLDDTFELLTDDRGQVEMHHLSFRSYQLSYQSAGMEKSIQMLPGEEYTIHIQPVDSPGIVPR